MEHGTATGWRHHRCRCDACHAALLADAKVTWALRQVRGGRDPATRVRVREARLHLARLEAAGMSRAEVARRACVSPSTISRLADPTTLQASRITVNAVRAVVG